MEKSKFVNVAETLEAQARDMEQQAARWEQTLDSASKASRGQLQIGIDTLRRNARELLITAEELRVRDQEAHDAPSRTSKTRSQTQ